MAVDRHLMELLSDDSNPHDKGLMHRDTHMHVLVPHRRGLPPPYRRGSDRSPGLKSASRPAGARPATSIVIRA